MANPLTRLLSKKMTRREFLLSLGVLIMGFMGISNFLKSFINPAIPKKKNKENGRSFGAGPYGV
jgi:hypothetical protein